MNIEFHGRCDLNSGQRSPERIARAVDDLWNRLCSWYVIARSSYCPSLQIQNCGHVCGYFDPQDCCACIDGNFTPCRVCQIRKFER